MAAGGTSRLVPWSSCGSVSNRKDGERLGLSMSPNGENEPPIHVAVPYGYPVPAMHDGDRSASLHFGLAEAA